MHFLTFSKIVSLLSVIKSCSSYDTKEDIKFEKLFVCLIKAGVDETNIIRRDMEGYSELNWQWNTVHGNVTPIAYLLPSSDSEIRKAVICSQSSRVRIVPKNGGHSYVKNGFGDSNSLIVDLRKLNKFRINKKESTIQIESGAQIGLISYELTRRNFILPLGTCPSVGISGLSLGGGWGYFTRQYGLTTDHIVGMEMVDANGELLVINNITNADLFFALRGSGGGNFGIVTKFIFEMHPAPDSLVFGRYEFNFVKDFELFYKAYQKLITKSPNNIGTIVHLTRDEIVLQIYYINVEASSTKGSEELSNILDNFPKPTHSNITVMTYPRFLLKISQNYSDVVLRKISQLASITKEINARREKTKSFYVNKILDSKDIYNFFFVLLKYLRRSGLAFLQNGGAMNKVSRSESAFIHREHLYEIQMKAFNLQQDSAAKAFFEKTKRIFDHRESYQNYLDEEMPNYLERYYGEQLGKLVEIKRKYDPNNVFHHPQSIPTLI